MQTADLQSYSFRVSRYLPLPVVLAHQSELFSLMQLGKSPLEAAVHIFVYGRAVYPSPNN